MGVIITEKDFTSPAEQFNDWYYSHLLGGITSPYAAYMAAASRYQERALINFCMVNCPNKFNKNDRCTCKKTCNELKMFEYLTYTK